ncbi:SulA-like leucine-rich domain-containing protein [Pseudomonadota bacterium]
MSAVNLSLDFNLTGKIQHPEKQTISTGYAALDIMLPHGGWPVGAITEIFCPDDRDFALPLVLPALAHLSQTQRWLTLVSPPNTPSSMQLRRAGVDSSHLLMIHPHATTNGLWAVEQALRAGTSSAVLSWVNSADYRTMQDLRGAALAGNSCGLVFRPDWAINQPSANNLRLSLTPMSDQSIYIELLSPHSSDAKSAIFIHPYKQARIA